jgi:hypothetical protein
MKKNEKTLLKTIAFLFEVVFFSRARARALKNCYVKARDHNGHDFVMQINLFIHDFILL